MIQTKNLSLALGGQRILHSIDVTIKAHGTTVILGANGAGKSTLLKCMTGDQRPDSGTIHYANRELSSYTDGDLARKRAVLSQSVTVPFPFLAKEIVRMGRQPFEATLRSKENDAIADAALRRVGGWPLRDRLFPTLSGGEKQRIQLARVLAQIWELEDGILFLDEPNAALDLRFQMELMTIIAELVQHNGLTVVVILHDVLLARGTCHHAVLMKDGKILDQGPAAATITNASVSSTYDYPYDLL